MMRAQVSTLSTLAIAHLQKTTQSIQKCVAMMLAFLMLASTSAIGLPSGQSSPNQTLPDQTLPNQTLSNQALPNQPSSQNPPAAGAFTLPAGTRLPLGLLRPISVKNAKPGMFAYLQVIFPVSAGKQMLIPPGTYLQGEISRILRRDRSRAIVEFEMNSANLIFSNGYTVTLNSTVTVSYTISQVVPTQPINAPSVDGMPVPVMAAVGGPPALPPLPPLPKPSLGGVERAGIIGLGVVGAIGITAAILHARHYDILMDIGTPMEVVLTTPLALDPDKVLEAVRINGGRDVIDPPSFVPPHRQSVMCHDPGSPGTPDIVIPGNPGTPDTVIPGLNGAPDTVIPGIPATPDTVISGTPATPERDYQCVP